MKTDIRVEVMLADLISGNLNMEDIIVESASLFKRNYHFDVENISEIEQGINKRKKIRFVVNREGIYDQLPEDLFHQVPETRNVADKYEAIQEIKEQRDLEKQSRLFFQPIEQEFYRQRVKLEVEERKFLFETNHVLPGEIFDYLWDLPEFLDDLQKSKLGLLMPVIHKMTGIKNLLPFIFESITGDRIEIKQSSPEKYLITESPVLGDTALGLDSILGGVLTDLQSAFTIIIFIDNLKKLPDYMPGGKKMVMHDYLCTLFMPHDAAIIFETAFTETFPAFFIEEEVEFQGRLNYTTLI